MQRLPFEQQVFLLVQTLSLLGLAIRMWQSGLYRVYSYFFAYLLLALLQAGVLASVPFGSRQYVYAWMGTEGLITCTYVLVVLETYSLILRDLSGIATAARRYIRIMVLAAVLISLLMIVLDRNPATIYGFFLTCYRIVLSALLIIVLASLVFLVYYPIPLTRNVVFYSIGYSVYLLARAPALLIANYSHFEWFRQLDAVFTGVPTACLLFWFFTLNRNGEAKTVVVGHHWKPEDEKRILSHLQAINDSLFRSARK
ncbi:MAG TPA: hypothetical protein VEV17_13515 [Bryobacteraceae bacterium]|nr:hypothetical protein [Bryobacteraceae bacterium]